MNFFRFTQRTKTPSCVDFDVDVDRADINGKRSTKYMCIYIYLYIYIYTYKYKGKQENEQCEM